MRKSCARSDVLRVAQGVSIRIAYSDALLLLLRFNEGP